MTTKRGVRNKPASPNYREDWGLKETDEQIKERERLRKMLAMEYYEANGTPRLDTKTHPFRLYIKGDLVGQYSNFACAVASAQALTSPHTLESPYCGVPLSDTEVVVPDRIRHA